MEHSKKIKNIERLTNLFCLDCVLQTTTRFGRVVKQNRPFNPGTGPASKWRDSVAESLLRNVKEESAEENAGCQGNHGPGLEHDNEPSSFHQTCGDDTESDSDDSDRTVPMDKW
jgi:hypothetical protein